MQRCSYDDSFCKIGCWTWLQMCWLLIRFSGSLNCYCFCFLVSFWEVGAVYLCLFGKGAVSKPVVQHELWTVSYFYLFLLALSGSWIFFVIDPKHFSSPLCSNFSKSIGCHLCICGCYIDWEMVNQWCCSVGNVCLMCLFSLFTSLKPDLWLWIGSRCRSRPWSHRIPDRVCGHTLVQGSWNHAEF